MSMKRKRIEITVETDRLLVITSPRQETRWCPTCGSRARMIPVDDAALLAYTDSRSIFRLVEAGRLHSSETAQGLLLVCLDSLFK